MLHDFFVKAVIDLTPGPGKFAQAALDSRSGYVGICFTEEHAAALDTMLCNYVLKQMACESSGLYNPRYAKDLGLQQDPAPKAAAKGKAKAKAKAKATPRREANGGEANGGEPETPAPVTQKKKRRRVDPAADPNKPDADGGELDGCGSPLDSEEDDDDDQVWDPME